ncbi:MAG TPA: protein translocase subunit SecD, partial [Cellvibrio sp.]|nr:protein translocase subunit SecD [Cellvibrio sp.]
MLNRYPLWKYLLILFVAILGFIYSVPNLYTPDPAVQISGDSSGTDIDQAVLQQVEKALNEAGIDYFGAEANGKSALVRFQTGDQQIRAQRALKSALGTSYIVALNSAPTTPDWLSSLGAAPMKLGLDLSGGVHFLMEVDTAAAIAKRQEITADEIKDKLRKARIRYSDVVANRDNVIVARFRSEELRDEALSEIRGDYPNILF